VADNDPAPDLIPAWYDLLTEARRQRDETAAQARGEIAVLRDQLRAAREEAGRQMPCGHPPACMVTVNQPDADPYCGWCAAEAEASQAWDAYAEAQREIEGLTTRLAAAEGLLRRLLASAELHCHGTGEAEDAASAYLEGKADG
jgi:hypothetical protein